MPKVLRIINRLNLGGPTYNAAYLTKYLDDRYETLLLAGLKDETEASSEFIVKNLGIEPKYVEGMQRSINPFKDVFAYLRIKSIILDFKPDIVHTHAAKAGALGRLAAYHCKIPAIVHTFHGHVFHSYFNPLKTRTFIEIERYLAKISTKIIAISELQKRELSSDFNICPKGKIEVIPLGFDLKRFQVEMKQKRNDFRKTYLLGDDEIAIGIIGRLVPIKNHTLFLKAFKKVLDQTTKKVRAFIIGGGEEEENLVRLADELDMTYSMNHPLKKAPLTFTSWIKNIDTALAGLDIVALTSYNEGTPVSLIEAQAANKAIVTTAVGGVKDVVVEDETALLSSSNDVTQFSENLLRLVENNSLRDSLGKRGSNFVLDKYSYSRLVRDTTSLYDNLLIPKVI